MYIKTEKQRAYERIIKKANDTSLVKRLRLINNKLYSMPAKFLLSDDTAYLIWKRDLIIDTLFTRLEEARNMIYQLNVPKYPEHFRFW